MFFKLSFNVLFFLGIFDLQLTQLREDSMYRAAVLCCKICCGDAYKESCRYGTRSDRIVFFTSKYNHYPHAQPE